MVHPIDLLPSDEEPGAVLDELTCAFRSGLPMVLWHPDAEPENPRELLDWVLPAEAGFIELPDRRKLSGS